MLVQKLEIHTMQLQGLQRMAWTLWCHGLSRVWQHRAHRYWCRTPWLELLLARSVCWKDARSVQLCQALLECVQDFRMNTPEFRDLMRIKLSLEFNSMFANVCSYHLELHVSSCGCILDEHLSPARLGIAYRKTSWRELGLKPSHSWLRSIAFLQFLTCNLWSFIVFLCIFYRDIIHHVGHSQISYGHKLDIC